MRHTVRCVLALGVLAVGVGCKAKLVVDVTVDGEKFVPTSCRSGQVYGFVGVELVADNGTKLRLAQTPTNEAVAFLIPAGESTGVEIGACGPFSVNDQNSTINDVQNVEGDATLDCTKADHTIKGTVSFGNCH